MADSDTPGTLHLPARDIPVPAHLSPEARAALAQPLVARGQHPALDDTQGWLELIAAADAMLADSMRDRVPADAFACAQVEVGGVPAFDFSPVDGDAGDRRVCLYIHGGALYMGGGEACRLMSLAMANKLGRRMISVDYRMPPLHPYPAALDDVVAAYRALLGEHDPSEIIVAGGSAGANLAAALLLRAGDEGLPMPAALVLNSPEADLTESGDSFRVNDGVDSMGSLMKANLLYAAGHDLADPYLSPLFGDLSRFPPTILTTGTRDLFLSNTVRMHRKLRDLGIEAELHVAEACPHVQFGGASPEEASLDREVARFCEAHWPRD